MAANATTGIHGTLDMLFRSQVPILVPSSSFYLITSLKPYNFPQCSWAAPLFGYSIGESLNYSELLPLHHRAYDVMVIIIMAVITRLIILILLKDLIYNIIPLVLEFINPTFPLSGIRV